MGSKSSKTSKDKKTKEIKLKPQFFGMNNYNESFSTTQNTQSEKDSRNFLRKNSKEKKYCFKFEWKGNGKSVLLAGSFLDNWNDIKVMVKNHNTEIFERVVYLPKGKHQFKFIVDNKWICSNQYPTMSDEQGNINNYIDLTNYFPKKNSLEENQKNFYFNINIKNKDYTTQMPKGYELNLIAPNIIGHYKPLFNLEYHSNQNVIRKNKYLKYKEKNLMTENNTFKKILVFPHEKLMHLCPCINDLDLSKGKNNNNNYIKISTTIRNKHKFLTIIYYRPKKNI